jgi:hypothetical protein
MNLWKKSVIQGIAMAYWRGERSPRCACGTPITITELVPPEGWHGPGRPLELRCDGCGMFAIWSGPYDH